MTSLNLSDPTTGWVSSNPYGRTSFDILWSCLSTTFICVWAALHLNVPPPRPPRPEKLSASSRVTWKLRDFRRDFLYKFKWMVLTLIAPEVIVLFGCDDLYHARNDLRRMRDAGIPGWSLTRCHYANSGGLAIRCDDDGLVYPVTAPVLHELVADGLMSFDDITITDEEIADKSKADWLVKATACLQSGWLVLQIIARAAQRLAVAELELATCAFVLCGLLIYSLNWEKPKDVQTPTLVPTRKPVTRQYLQDTWPKCSRDEEFIQAALNARHISNDPDDGVIKGTVARLIESLPYIVIGTAIGAVHCAGWNFHFPTHTERLLWRIASVATTCLPIITIPLLVYHRYYSALDFGDYKGKEHPHYYVYIGSAQILALFLCLFVYILARAFLLIEVFIALRSQPTSVYNSVDWTLFLPHAS